MGRKAQDGWVVLSPPFPEHSAEKQAFKAHAVRLSELLNEDVDGENVNEAIQESLASTVHMSVLPPCVRRCAS